MSDAAQAATPGGGASSKSWAAVGTVLSVMLAVVVIFWIIGMLLSPAAGGLEQIAIGFKAVNKALFGLKYESNQMIINLIQMLVLPVLLFLLVKYWALK